MPSDEARDTAWAKEIGGGGALIIPEIHRRHAFLSRTHALTKLQKKKFKRQSPCTDKNHDPPISIALRTQEARKIRDDANERHANPIVCVPSK
jgi:hypothetical protein